MSILSSLVMGHALHAHGGATVTYQAVMATLTQVMRIGQALVVVGLFYGVVRLFLAFLRKATTLPCSHGFADLTECLDCSHPDWFNEVERYRSELSPVVESVRITQACPECSIVSPLEVLTPNLPNINRHALDLLCDECGCITPLAVTDWETVEPVAVEIVEPLLERSGNSGFTLCPDCEGSGSSSAYLGDFTMSELYEHGEDFVDDYFAGNLDRDCETCKGQRVVRACVVVGCLSSVVNVSSPWSSEVTMTKNCYEHLTPDELESVNYCAESWSEFRSGC